MSPSPAYPEQPPHTTFVDAPFPHATTEEEDDFAAQDPTPYMALRTQALRVHDEEAPVALAPRSQTPATTRGVEPLMVAARTHQARYRPRTVAAPPEPPQVEPPQVEPPQVEPPQPVPPQKAKVPVAAIAVLATVALAAGGGLAYIRFTQH